MLTRVKTDRSGVVLGVVCHCARRLVKTSRPDVFACVNCGDLWPARRVFLAINARVVH